MVTQNEPKREVLKKYDNGQYDWPESQKEKNQKKPHPSFIKKIELKKKKLGKQKGVVK